LRSVLGAAAPPASFQLAGRPDRGPNWHGGVVRWHSRRGCHRQIHR